MNNNHTITISLQFCFRGQTFNPSLQVDLDHWMQRSDGNPDELHHHLAESIGFGPYSYEYDVLMMSEIEFSSDVDWIQKYIHQGRLDIPACNAEWQEKQILNRVLPIAEKHLSQEVLNGNPEITQALIESYRSGQMNPNKRIMREAGGL